MWNKFSRKKTRTLRILNVSLFAEMTWKRAINFHVVSAKNIHTIILPWLLFFAISYLRHHLIPNRIKKQRKTHFSFLFDFQSTDSRFLFYRHDSQISYLLQVRTCMYIRLLAYFSSYRHFRFTQTYAHMLLISR